MQSAETGNAAGILAGALEAAAAVASGIALLPGQDTQTLDAIAAVTGTAGIATQVANDFNTGNLGQGLVDSLNLYLPAVARAYLDWANGTGSATQPQVTMLPAQQAYTAMTQDGGLPTVGLALATDELTNGAVPDGTELSAEQAADLQASLALSLETSTASGLFVQAATTPEGGSGSGSASGSGAGDAIGNTLTITLPPMQLDTGVTVDPSVVETMPSAGTIIITPGPGSQNIIQTRTITVSPTTPGSYQVTTPGNATSAGGSSIGATTGGNSAGTTTSDTAAVASGNLYLPTLEFLYSHLSSAMLPPAEAATPTAQSTVPRITTDQITPLALGPKPAVAFVGGWGDSISGIVQNDFSQYQQLPNRSPSAYFSWTDGSSLAAWIQQEDNAGYQVTVIAHSYGADTAATAAANGSKVFNLVLLDPVSAARPSLSAIKSNATNFYDYNATGGSFLQTSNLIAGIGQAWNNYAAGVAQMYNVTDANHAAIGSWKTVSKLLVH